jgi:hypothetical protein
MATVVNRTAVPLEILYSVNTPDYDPAYWIINPDLTILETVPLKYCKVSGDLIVEMTAAEKAAVDAAELAAAKTSATNRVCATREIKIEYGAGPEYPAASGKHIATTWPDQVRWLAWQQIGGKWASLGMSYPFRVHSRDGSTYVNITKANDFTAVLEAIGVYITGLFTEAEGVIQNVLAATTVAQVQSIVDAYVATAPAVPSGLIAD